MMPIECERVQTSMVICGKIVASYKLIYITENRQCENAHNIDFGLLNKIGSINMAFFQWFPKNSLLIFPKFITNVNRVFF